MVVKDKGKDFEPIPTGTQLAVCVANHDIGMQPGYKGGAPKHKVVLVWELEERRTMGDFAGQRFVVCKKYTASLDERANLTKDLESWRGKAFTPQQREGFELNALHGKNCNLNMVESDNGYVNVASITGLIKGQKPMEPEQPGYMPKWIAGLIQAEAGDSNAPEFDDDDIPF